MGFNVMTYNKTLHEKKTKRRRNKKSRGNKTNTVRAKGVGGPAGAGDMDGGIGERARAMRQGSFLREIAAMPQAFSQRVLSQTQGSTKHNNFEQQEETDDEDDHDLEDDQLRDDELDEPESDLEDEEEFDDQEEQDPDLQGIIRTVDNAHLVYKRQTGDGDYEELWIYNVQSDLRNDLDIRRNILAGTDIPQGKTKSEDGSQYYDIVTLGNAQLLHISGLPN